MYSEYHKLDKMSEKVSNSLGLLNVLVPLAKHYHGCGTLVILGQIERGGF